MLDNMCCDLWVVCFRWEKRKKMKWEMAVFCGPVAQNNILLVDRVIKLLAHSSYWQVETKQRLLFSLLHKQLLFSAQYTEVEDVGTYKNTGTEC